MKLVLNKQEFKKYISSRIEIAIEFTLSTIITPINKIVDGRYKDGGRKFRSGKIYFDEGNSPEAKENEFESSNVLIHYPELQRIYRILLYYREMENKKEKDKLLNNYLKRNGIRS